MPDHWPISIVVQIFMGRVIFFNCGCYRVVKLLEHAMKVMKWMLENRFHRIMTVKEMQFSFMPEKGMIDAVFILRSLQEKYHAKGRDLYLNN